MKFALKYGLIIAAGLILWVLIAHLLVPDPNSSVHSVGAATFFNLLHFTMLFLGLRAAQREAGNQLTFKEGMKTGVSISFIYAVTAALFFVGVMMVVGDRWIPRDPGTAEMAPWLVAIRAFAGIVMGTMLFGLVYTALISFFLAKRRSSEA